MSVIISSPPGWLPNTKKAKNKFGSWTLAATYNEVFQACRIRCPKVKVILIWDWVGKQIDTFRILAIKEIIENPSKYGYVFDDSDLYFQFRFDITADAIFLILQFLHRKWVLIIKF